MSSLASDRYAGLKLPPVSPGVMPEPELVRVEEPETAAVADALAERIAVLEERERAVVGAAMALEAQRDQLVAIRAEYEARREALDRRGNELAQDRLNLRAAQAELEASRTQLGERERLLAEREAAPGDHLPGSASAAPEPLGPGRPPAPPENTPDDSEWWRKQLGRPLEAA